MHTRLSLLAAVLLLAGCTPDATPDADRPAETRLATRPPEMKRTLSPDSLVGTFDGYYWSAFETSGFVACAETTVVWLASFRGGEAWKYRELERAQTEAVTHRVFTVWVRAQGAVSARGEVPGWIGSPEFSREFNISSLLDMRVEPPPDACTRPRIIDALTAPPHL